MSATTSRLSTPSTSFACLAIFVSCPRSLLAIDRSEFTPVYSDQFTAKQPHLTTQLLKPSADSCYCIQVVLAKVSDRLMVWCQLAHQPHQLQIASRLLLQLPARTDPIQVT